MPTGPPRAALRSPVAPPIGALLAHSARKAPTPGFRPLLGLAPYLPHPAPERLHPVEDRVGDLLLRRERDVMIAGGLDDRHLVELRVEADLGSRDVVEDDRV